MGKLRTATALTVLALLAACTAEAGRDTSGDPDPRAERRFNLGDGRSVEVETTRSGDLVVRWREPGEQSWGEDERVFQGEGRHKTYLRARVGGATLALFATYSPSDTVYNDELSHNELIADDVTVFVVCRDGSCDTSPEYDGLVSDPPQVTPDGDHVLLADLAGTYVTWHDGTFTDQRPSGLPDGTYGGRQPLLAPDGSLRAVHGQPVRGGCELTLLVSEPAQSGFREAVRYLHAGSRKRCATTLESFAPDYVVASHSKYDAAFFARDGDAWKQVSEDPSGQIRYPRTGKPRLAGAFERTGFWHWRQAVASSPDGRSLVVQLHFPGDQRWRPPKLVARAPKGWRCARISPMPTYTHGEEDPLYISLSCDSPDTPGEFDGSVMAVTDDGKTWHSFRATDATRVGRDMFFGTHRWSPDTGLVKIPLEVPTGSRITLLATGGYALTTLVRSPRQCHVEVRVAVAAASEWSDPVPSTASPVSLEDCSLTQVQAGGRGVYVELGAPDAQAFYRTVRLVWRGGEPLLEDARS